MVHKKRLVRLSAKNGLISELKSNFIEFCVEGKIRGGGMEREED